jgi:hypothetical protein
MLIKLSLEKFKKGTFFIPMLENKNKTKVYPYYPLPMDFVHWLHTLKPNVILLTKPKFFENFSVNINI